MTKRQRQRQRRLFRKHFTENINTIIIDFSSLYLSNKMLFRQEDEKLQEHIYMAACEGTYIFNII